jgi:uncharacterized membrane protein YfhO
MANALWPNTLDLESARKACKSAAVGAFIVAGLTAIVAAISLGGSTIIAGINGWAFLDAGIFALLGLFVWRCSRVAAVITLAMFILERVMMMAQNGIAGFPVALILLYYFIVGVRGAFAYHRMQSETAKATAAGGTIG